MKYPLITAAFATILLTSYILILFFCNKDKIKTNSLFILTSLTSISVIGLNNSIENWKYMIITAMVLIFCSIYSISKINHKDQNNDEKKGKNKFFYAIPILICISISFAATKLNSYQNNYTDNKKNVSKEQLEVSEQKNSDESKQIEDSEVIKLEKKEGNFLRENMDDILISIFVIIILVSIKKFTLNKSTGN